ncbi:MAG TPA: tRNA pseudouridine(55) synthase TruB [Candidatus Limnocylindrales bacterium]|nr:tRNA pseudouridine(55) synthase TruB [Candidatus Limnocylindrales bacterium]
MSDRPRGMDGILVVAKDPGFTSHDVVALVRRLTGTRRVGHGGTLDPFASGVLPVFLGLATRLVEYHMGDTKAYRSTVCFGSTSETDDRDGELVRGSGAAPTREAVESALAEFRGPIQQRPPAYSAVKVGGRRAYQLARQGKPLELPPRAVTIHRLELEEWDASDPDRPTAVLEVECGAGTYIRSLARDLGERLGCGAYLGALTRTASGPFRLAAAHSLDEIRGAAAQGPVALAALLLPIDAGLEGIATVVLDEAETAAVVRGQQIKPAQRPEAEQDDRLRILDGHRLLIGIGSWKGGRVVPEKIFVGPGNGDRPAGEADDAAPPSAPTGERPLRMVRAGNRMNVVSGIDNLTPDLGRLYLAVGVFDGLHRGHLYLLRELRKAAARAGARPAIVTFDAHPEEVIEGLAPPLLCDPDERLVRLEAAGIEVAVVQHFDHALRITTYDEFASRIADRVDLAGFAMTPDAAFGFERRGTPEALTELGARVGFAVTIVNSYLLDGEQVRSSEIRRRVSSGDLLGARRLLGRPLSLTGRTTDEVAGAAGRQVAFDVPVCLPPNGTYPVLVGPGWAVSGTPAPAAARGTAAIEDGSLVLDASGSFMDERIRILFVDSPDAAAPQG